MLIFAVCHIESSFADSKSLENGKSGRPLFPARGRQRQSISVSSSPTRATESIVRSCLKKGKKRQETKSISVHVCACVCSQMHIHMCVHKCGGKCPPPCILRQGLSQAWKLSSRLGCLASKPRSALVSASPRLGLYVGYSCPFQF